MCSRHVIRSRDYVSVSQPPRPPTWRDVQSPDGQSKKRDLKFTDISVVQKASSDGDTNKDKQGKQKPDCRRYKKASVHRTRSETHLNSSDLPDNYELTTSLAKTKPQLYTREYGLRTEKAIKNAQVYLSQNIKKCTKWLEDVHACEPLEDVEINKFSGVDIDVSEDYHFANSHKEEVDQTSHQMSLTQENVIRQQGVNDSRVVVHHILVHEYSEAQDNTQSTSATLAESDGSNQVT